MPLIEINADFKSLLAVLDRIADALERAHPLPSPKPSAVPNPPRARVRNDAYWAAVRRKQAEKLAVERGEPMPEATDA